MYSVLNTFSEYTYFDISKNITTYTFVTCFQNLRKRQSFSVFLMTETGKNLKKEKS